MKRPPGPSVALLLGALLAGALGPAWSEGGLAKLEASGAAATDGGWVKQGNSLLYYKASGDLAQEIPLEGAEENSGTRVNAREMRAGASGNGRFAWTLDRTVTWNVDRTKQLDSRRLLKFYGSDGKELWEEGLADVPSASDPVAFSADGQRLVVALNRNGAWSAAVKDYIGGNLVVLGPFPHLDAVAITANGRYALARWTVPDQSATHTFVDVKTKARKDIPSGDLILGLAKVTDDGQVLSGRKLVYDFRAAEPKEDPAPAGTPPATTGVPAPPAKAPDAPTGAVVTKPAPPAGPGDRP